MNSIICYKVSDITKDGIILEFKKNKIHINFDDCAKNFSTENNIECSKCVESAISKFLNLQKAIVEAGYTSYDFS